MTVVKKGFCAGGVYLIALLLKKLSSYLKSECALSYLKLHTCCAVIKMLGSASAINVLG